MKPIEELEIDSVFEDQMYAQVHYISNLESAFVQPQDFDIFYERS